MKSEDQHHRPAGRGTGGGTLVVGASQAGLQLAVSLRQGGDTAPITVVGEEAHAPYQRPPLSKEFLTGAAGEEALELRAPGFYEEQGIALVRGERVEEVSLAPAAGAPGRGVAVTVRGRTLRFDRLALTVGAAPRRLEVPGAGLAGIGYLRDREDAAALRERLAHATEVVVVGGGFVGLETAAAARALGARVTVVEAGPRLLARAVAPVVSAFYARAHRARGTEVLLGATVAAFEGERGRVTGVLLGDGRRLPAQAVVIGIGVVPRTELARRLGLECEGGVVVDAGARTSAPGVVAAGDCTVRPHPLTGLGRLRIESVQNAVAQAGAAAASLLGVPVPARAPVPWFWSHQGDLRLQTAGLSTGFDRCVLRGAPRDERFSALYFHEDRLVAVDAVNAPADYMAVRRALDRGLDLTPEQAADTSVPLKAHLTARESLVQPG